MFHANTYLKILSKTPEETSGRPVTLIGVTKYASITDMEAAYEAGMRHFGENRLDVALPKIQHFKSKGVTDIEWHFIGHLQRKKVPKLEHHFAVIHSVDSIELANKLHTTARQLNTTRSVFVQVNIANEPQKSGFSLEELDEAISHIQKHCPTIGIEGLMTMLPKDCPEADAHHWYQHTAQLNQRYGFSQLSMGMTQDYPIALKYGATHLRIGRALFTS